MTFIINETSKVFCSPLKNRDIFFVNMTFITNETNKVLTKWRVVCCSWCLEEQEL